MSLQFSVTVRNARLDAIETAVGTAPVLTIRTGAQPATCATANSGTVLATITLPSNWMNDASSGSKTLLGTWQDASADAAGTAQHFRIHESTATTCHLQGDIGQGSGTMSLDNTNIAVGQVVTVTSFTLTDANS